jgi:hypothetical protein
MSSIRYVERKEKVFYVRPSIVFFDGLWVSE